MGKPLRVLMVEDSEDDALLVLRELRAAGYDPTHERVDTARGTADPGAVDVALDELRVCREVLHDADARERGRARQRGSSFSSTQ